MAIEDTRPSQSAAPQAVQCSGRILAIGMIGLGAACCCSIELFQRYMPDLAAIPGLVGALLALGGLLLLFRCQVKQARFEAARKRECLRLAPYLPEMLDGSNGAVALSVALAPADAAAVEPAICTGAKTPVRRRQPLMRSHANQNGATVTLFNEAHQPRRNTGAPAAFYAALRLGGEWTQDLDLSPRAQARLEADPFVQRLARLS